MDQILDAFLVHENWEIQVYFKMCRLSRKSAYNRNSKLIFRVTLDCVTNSDQHQRKGRPSSRRRKWRRLGGSGASWSAHVAMASTSGYTDVEQEVRGVCLSPTCVSLSSLFTWGRRSCPFGPPPPPPPPPPTNPTNRFRHFSSEESARQKERSHSLSTTTLHACPSHTHPPSLVRSFVRSFVRLTCLTACRRRVS